MMSTNLESAAARRIRAMVDEAWALPEPPIRAANVAEPEPAEKKPAESLIQSGFWVRDAVATLDLPYVVKGIIHKHQVVVFWGGPGSGKSFVALELLACVGTGAMWRGRRTKRGACILVSAESSKPLIQNRIEALKTENPALAGSDVLVLPLGLDLLHEGRGDVDLVIGTARELAADLGEVAIIAIDTLAATFGGGDENSPQDMGAFVSNIQRIVRETGAAVLVIHHCGKNEASGMRGHSALLGALDAELTIEGGVTGERILRTGKVRDGEAGTDLFAFSLRQVELGIDPDGDAVTTCVIDSMDAAGTERARRKRKGVGLGKHQKAVLRAVEDAGGRISRPDLIRQLKDAGVPKNRVSEAIASLLDSKMLVAMNGITAEIAFP